MPIALLAAAAVGAVSASAQPFSVSTLDANADARQPALAADQNGMLHVAYYDDNSFTPSANAGYVVYARKPSGGGWSAPLQIGQGFFPAGSNNDGFENTDPPGVSLAVGVNGDVHISFFSNSGGAYRVWYAKVNGGVLRSSAPVTSVGVTYSTYTAIAVDGAGNPRIAFVGSGGVLGFARFNGVSWSTATADGAAAVGYVRGAASTPDEEAVGVRQLALALDATGYAHVAYFDVSTAAVKYAGSADGIHFSTQTIVRLGADNMSGVSLALDGSGRPRASCVDNEGGFFPLFYSSRSAAGGWSSTFAVVYDSVTQVGPLLSSVLSLDGNGAPAMAFHGLINSADAALFAWQQGGSFSTSTADSARGAASLSFTLDASADPLLAYSDSSNNFQPTNTPAPLFFAAGGGFGLSAPMGGNAGGKAQAPDGFAAASVYRTSVTWSWTSHSSNDTGYRLFEGQTSTGPFTLVADTNLIGPCHASASPCRFSQSGLAPQTSYFAYIAAVNAGGVVTSSGALTMTGLPAGILTVLSTTSLAPANAARNQSDVALLRFNLAAGSNSVRLTSVAFQRSGGRDSDLQFVRLYKDANGDGIFEPGGDALMTSGTGSFASGASTLAFTAGDAASTLAPGSTAVFFLVADIASSAAIGDSLSAVLGSSASIVASDPEVAVSVANLPARSNAMTIQAALADVAAVAPTPATGTWTNATAFIFDGNIGAAGVDHYFVNWSTNAAYNVGAGDVLYQGTNAYSTNTAAATGFWYFHARAYTAGGSAGTQQDLGPYWVDLASPSPAGFLTFNSTGAALGESQWNGLAAGVTAQLSVADPTSGLSVIPGTYGVQVSTDAGATWTAIISTAPSGGPYVRLTGAQGSVSTQTLTAYNLSLVQSAGAAACGGAAPCAAAVQLKFTASDAAGNALSAGPYAALIDTTPPSAALASLSASGSTITAAASGTDNLSGVRDFNFEASLSPVFASPVSSSGFVSASSFTFTGLSAPTTYYVRVTARDNALNIGAPSAVLSTSTTVNVIIVSSDIAAAGAPQGAEAALLRLTLSSDPGPSAGFSSLRVTRTGSATDSDVAAVEVYLDNGDGVFVSTQDALLGSSVFSGGIAAVSFASQTVTTASRNYFIVYRLGPQGVAGGTVGARLSSPADVGGVSFPFVSQGAFPAVSGQTTIQDAPNTLSLSGTSLSPSTAPPAVADLAVLKVTAQTNTGTSLLDSLTLHLLGTLPSNMVSAVKIYLAPDLTSPFNPAVDTLVSSGADLFAKGVATVAFTAPAASRTVAASPSQFFISVNLSPAALPDQTFAVALSTPADVALADFDSVVFSTVPISSNMTAVEVPNTVAATISDATPSVFIQGANTPALKISLTVDKGTAQINQVTVKQTEGVPFSVSDVSSAKVYQDADSNGGPFDPANDLLLGQAPLVQALSSLGSAVIDISTVTLTAGATTTLFATFQVSTAPVFTDDMGARLDAGGLRAANPYTTVTGNFGFATATYAIAPRVNTLTVSPSNLTSGGLLQGATNAALLRLDVHSDSFTITWSSLTLTRLGSGPDSDAASVKVYLDAVGDGILRIGTDTLVTSGLDVFSAGSAAVAFNAPQAVASSTRTYLVALDVSSNAAAGDSLGVAVLSAAGFRLNSPNVASSTFPITAGPVPIDPYPNTVTVSTASVVPSAGAFPGDRDVPIMKLTLATDRNAARWLSLQLDRSGGADSDAAALKIYYDPTGGPAFDPAKLSSGVYVAVAAGAFTFASQGTPGTVTVALSTSAPLNSVPAAYYVTLDVSTGAAPGDLLSVQALGRGYFGVSAPNTVAPTSFASAPLRILQPATPVFVLASGAPPQSAAQGTADATMLALNLWTTRYSAQWTGLTVYRSGSGRDADVSRVKLYYDSNGDGLLDPGTDTLLASAAFSSASATLTFTAQTVGVSTKTFFIAGDISPSAAVGDAISVALPVSSDVVVSTPAGVLTQNFPILSAATSIVPAQEGLLVSARNRAPGSLLEGSTAQVMLSLTLQTTANLVIMSRVSFEPLGTATGADISSLRIYLDADGDGVLAPSDPLLGSVADPFVNGIATVSLASPEMIGVSSRTYLVAVDVAPFADFSRTFGIRVAGPGAIGLNSPNFAVNSGFPFDSNASPISKIPESLLVSGTSLLGGGALQGTTVVAARFSLSAGRLTATLNRWKLALIGTAADQDIDAVQIYKDLNGNGILDAGDMLVGAGTFANGVADISLSSAQTVGVSSSDYLVTLSVDLNAPVGDTIGLSLPGASYLGVAPPDAASSAGLPFSSNLAAVQDSRTPTQPSVTLPDGTSSSVFESLHFVWSSSVTAGNIASAVFAVGTSTGRSDVVPFTPLAASQTDVTVQNLALVTGTTYYVSVRATSNLGLTSVFGVSPGLLIDGLTPGQPPPPSVTLGVNTILLNWGTANAGPSGIKGYLVEYRDVNSAFWYNAKTLAVSPQGLTSLAAGTKRYTLAQLTASDLAAPPFGFINAPHGTLLFQVRAVSGAGLIGAASAPPIRVQFGGLPAGALSDVSSYPNPFDSRTGQATIVYDLSQPSDVRIQIFSVFGGKVREMNFGAGTSGGLAGTNEVTWDGSNESGSKVSKGVYLAVITAGGAKATYKIGVIH